MNCERRFRRVGGERAAFVELLDLTLTAMIG